MESAFPDPAFSDPLTGLYNRKYFFHVATTLLEQAARYGHPLSVMLLDVDYLKRINADYGRAFGDETLKHLATNIQETIRTADVAARLGSDEFAIVMSETNAQQATRLAQRLQLCLEENPMHAEQSDFRITLSIGIASSSEKKDVPSVQVLLDLAERALHEARAAGEKVGVYDLA